MQKQDFRKELAENAQRICTPGKGILAADEVKHIYIYTILSLQSEGTIGKKFATINLENTAESRRAYRELLFTAPELDKYISGVIFFSEQVGFLKF